MPHPNPAPIQDVRPDQVGQIVQDYHDAGAPNVATTKQPDGNFTIQAFFDAAPPPIIQPGAGITQITQLAASSEVARYEWRDRGKAPIGYIKGMAVVFARAYCRLKAGDPTAIEMAKADSGDEDKDALAWYRGRFAQVGMKNDVAGVDTLRHLFVLLIGLGMRESSGRYCEGWDRDKLRHGIQNTAENAEAGLFQVSFDIDPKRPSFAPLYNEYSSNNAPAGLKDIFAEGVNVRSSDASVGAGLGFDFQELIKNSPAFAAEFAAVALRKICRHWGPIIKQAAEVSTSCDAMLMQVQSTVDQSNLCPI
jgi:hypothetical protein